MAQNGSTQRFSNRVDDYVKYRPGYPDSVITILEKHAGLNENSIVADIGSGTGISTELFLKNGNTVYAVEPNSQMRSAAGNHLGHFPGFRSIDGTAESTTLPANCADLVISAQAFHWFDAESAKHEFARILRKPGKVVLIWNSRKTESSGFLRAYEHFLNRFGTDYRQVNHRNIDEQALHKFFSEYQKHRIDNEQVLDFEGLKGRVLSSSYIPAQDHPNHASMLESLQNLFDEHQKNGQVRIEYDVEIYIGNIR